MDTTTNNEELDEFEKKVRNTVALNLRSKAAVLQRLSSEIERLFDLGYNHARVIEVMKKGGLEFTIGTFRSSFSRVKQSDKSKTT